MMTGLAGVASRSRNLRMLAAMSGRLCWYSDRLNASLMPTWAIGAVSEPDQPYE